MKKNYLITLFLISLLVCSCSKEKKKGGFYQVFSNLSSVKNFNEAKDFYTSGTLDAVNSAYKKGLISDKDRLSLLPAFDSKTKISILDEKISGESALVIIRYAEHPVENMIGFDMNVRFLFRDGRWKIDFEREIKDVVDSFNKSRGADYIKEKAKMY